MWNKVASNRILDRMSKREAQYKHLRALRNIKSQINNSSPKQYSFLYSRPKAKQLENERKRDIDHHNSLLLRRMINSESSVRYRDDYFFKDSLNQPYNKKIDKHIDESNKMLAHRLQQTYSQYSQRGMSKALKSYKKVKTNLAHSKMDPFYDLEDSKLYRSQERKKFRPISAKY